MWCWLAAYASSFSPPCIVYVCVRSGLFVHLYLCGMWTRERARNWIIYYICLYVLLASVHLTFTCMCICVCVRLMCMWDDFFYYFSSLSSGLGHDISYYYRIHTYTHKTIISPFTIHHCGFHSAAVTIVVVVVVVAVVAIVFFIAAVVVAAATTAFAIHWYFVLRIHSSILSMKNHRRT